MNKFCKCPFSYCDDIASVEFIDKDTLLYTCLRNHTITNNVNEIRKINSKAPSDNDNKFCFCSEHNSKYLYFCKKCKINFCYDCKFKHDMHRHISLTEKIPPKNFKKIRSD